MDATERRWVRPTSSRPPDEKPFSGRMEARLCEQVLGNRRHGLPIPAAPPPADPDPRGLPRGVYLLGFCLFAMGSAEFLLAGMLPLVADDLHVPLATAGLLITPSRSASSSADRRSPCSSCAGRAAPRSR
ncbi:hypothetical protein [Agilicoccus flavus]|uniref:hypothetical protein n=1 Tax=Agilicoccus flavus TaxID=2775968 RepID=UPI001CF62DD4|nr:hypothetical protein [Agilicoccus flavus]